MRRALALVLFALALAVAGYAALVVRLSVEGERAMASSDASFDQGHLRDSIVYARRAASLYVPGLAHVHRADTRLDALALGAESGKLPRVALLAWQAIRSTELGRPVGLGRNNSRLTLANRRVSGLLALSGHSSALAVEERNYGRVLAHLETKTEGSHWGAVAQLVSLGVITAGLGLLALAIQRRGLRSKRSLLAAAIALSGSACWAICLALT